MWRGAGMWDGCDYRSTLRSLAGFCAGREDPEALGGPGRVLGQRVVREADDTVARDGVLHVAFAVFFEGDGVEVPLTAVELDDQAWGGPVGVDLVAVDGMVGQRGREVVVVNELEEGLFELWPGDAGLVVGDGRDRVSEPFCSAAAGRDPTG